MPTTTQVSTVITVASIGARTDFSGSAATDLTAEEIRNYAAPFTEGIIKPSTAFSVAKGSAATMNILVGSGTTKVDYAVVEGVASGMGSYTVRLDEATKTITLDAANVSNPRIDEIYLVVLDNAYDSAGKSLPVLAVRKGDAAASPTVPGPDSAWDAYLLLASVLVPASAADIIACTVTDERVNSGLVLDTINSINVSDHAVRHGSNGADQVMACKTYTVDNGGAAVSTAFVTCASTTFTPPAGWGTYDIFVNAHCGMLIGSTAGSATGEARVLIDGNAGTTVFPTGVTDGTIRAGLAATVTHERTSMSGAVVVTSQVRKQSGSGSAVVYNGNGSLMITAIRRS